ncbi:hypothetical protein GCM10025871_29240 [Deinococcus metallilatus]|nr:hypothetical protein GCM10025871_29240 [Deinococcus metallilatus]
MDRVGLQLAVQPLARDLVHPVRPGAEIQAEGRDRHGVVQAREGVQPAIRRHPEEGRHLISVPFICSTSFSAAL